MPALITPFNRSGSLDLAAHGTNVAHMWDRGLQGVLIAGSTGEGPYLEPGERRDLVATARRESPRAFILCGVHAETVRSAMQAIREAVEGGADAVLVVTPTTLVRHRPELIEAFFVDVVAESPLPVLLYSVPKVTGIELSEASVERLAPLDGVVGMKDSGGDPIRAGRLAGVEEGFKLLTGATAAVSLAIAGGAHGAITASANYAPRLVRDTVIASRRSVKSAQVLQARLSMVAGSIEQFGIPAVKYAAHRTGLVVGQPRRPLHPVAPQARSVIRRALRDAELA